MTYRGRGGFDPEQFFGPEGPFGPRGPLGPGGIFGPAGPFGTGGGWGGGWPGEQQGRHGHGPRGGGRGRPRARRGDVRNAVLKLLLDEPLNGYQLMQRIAEGTEGAWRPSSGAIYPALAQLEDEGLVRQTEIDGRKAYELTDAGRQAAEAGPDLSWSAQAGAEPEDPWAADRSHRGGRGPRGAAGFGPRGGGRRSAGQLWKALGSVAMATQAVGQAGDAQLSATAAELLEKTRRELYRLLAEAEVSRDDDWADATDDVDEVAEGEIMED
ncbi:hypothetical protein GCM10009584_03900 [Ornithinimicrobium humiphilum]|uniref:PadR family transcriptional regulator n=1 Tax=Ornithinimicrobium humiphilum TaxID=125288 RepID=A0A543K7Q5_9MICO|nr:PadR family transcriptional regulator [Ornithinimicrobium humiphilum]TQM91121.1 PadR family transcriptional regulator [Ornithinimicrobium humiphilum]